MNRDMKKVSPAMFHPSQNESVGGLHSKIARPSVRMMDIRSNTTNVAMARPVMLADGGDVSEAVRKQQGLESSSGEKVGFFERLRMGNIDDPNSEAYKRLGAGRGASEAAKSEAPAAAPATAPEPEPVKAEADDMEGALPPAAESKPEAPKAPAKAVAPAAPKKAPTRPIRPSAAPSKPAPKSSGMSLSQRLGKEFAELSQQAARAKTMKGASPASVAAVEKLAADKKRAYEAAAAAEKEGRSVVKVR